MRPGAAIPDSARQDLERLLGVDRFLTAGVDREAYAWDNTGHRVLPDAVALVTTEDEVCGVLRLCQAYRIPVTPRGAGTGNVGGCLAVFGGVVLSTQQMNRILEVSVADRYAVVEAGVVNGDLQKRLGDEDLFWPPDPSSARSCTVGGNIAMCSAGPGAVRWGVARDWVLGLEAVLMNGEKIRTGGRTTKGVVGFDMTRLLIGSEGTLAVVTRAILKLASKPEKRYLSRISFASVELAASAVSRLLSARQIPSAIEFLDGSALDLLRRETSVPIAVEARAMLLLEVAGAALGLKEQVEVMLESIKNFQPLEWTQPVEGAEAARVWEARSALSPILKRLAPKRINEDVVVPVSRLPLLMDGLEKISRASGIPIVSFGHAGNGNIHVNLLVDPQNATIMALVGGVLDRVFRLVLDLDGSLSGEHGVGTQKRDYIAWELDKNCLNLQKEIKRIFDPMGLLNPGKIWPLTEVQQG
ncbi:MAG: FAD linked oxidase domain protein [Magnetococcales bacterium]|nr:FAD linked oxidase domain protein [Magnetococcales bacterium]